MTLQKLLLASILFFSGVCTSHMNLSMSLNEASLSEGDIIEAACSPESLPRVPGMHQSLSLGAFEQDLKHQQFLKELCSLKKDNTNYLSLVPRDLIKKVVGIIAQTDLTKENEQIINQQTMGTYKIIVMNGLPRKFSWICNFSQICKTYGAALFYPDKKVPSARLFFNVIENQRDDLIAAHSKSNIAVVIESSFKCPESHDMKEYALLLEQVEKWCHNKLNCNSLEIDCPRLESDEFYGKAGYIRNGKKLQDTSKILK